ncbi:hypothetical protein DFH09DRAFT_1140717 [Mycena vulgaris]|nr:hypothetical protein DFH09DRAFT_1140717 [Mycena vulgaris]
MSRRPTCRWLNDGAFSLSLWDEDVLERKLTFVVPIEPTSPAIRALDVNLISTLCASRMTVKLAATVTAFHHGLLGIPPSAAAAEKLLLPTFEIAWVSPHGGQGENLTEEELSLPLNSSRVLGKGIYIVPALHLSFGMRHLERYIGKALKLAKGFQGDGGRNASAFRSSVLRQDGDRCVVTGNVGTLEAAHVVDRYVGSIIFGSVMDELYAIGRAYASLPVDIWQEAQLDQSLLFADVREVPTELALIPIITPPAIDRHNNGEALTPTMHTEKDIQSAYMVDPCSGIQLWLNLDTRNIFSAIASFGALEESDTPAASAPESGFYSNKGGIQPFDRARFFPRTLAFYTTFAKKFMPKDLRAKTVGNVSKTTSNVMTKEGYPSTEDVSIEAFEGEGEEAEPRGSASGEILDAPIRPSKSDESDLTVGRTDAYSDVWFEVADARFFSPKYENLNDEEEEDLQAYKERMEALHPLVGPKGFTAGELEAHHRNVVVQAILLLHVGAAIQARRIDVTERKGVDGVLEETVS